LEYRTNWSESGLELFEHQNHNVKTDPAEEENPPKTNRPNSSTPYSLLTNNHQ
jgi:hypothetical protein